MRYHLLREIHYISRKKQIYKCSYAYVMFIKEEIRDKQYDIDHYVECSERQSRSDLSPKSPCQALERIYTESCTFKEADGDRAQ